MRKFDGDTLIEVALAIGIFSMVAVAVIAVVNGSTSSAQSALELTIAREEIDSQAEALRFIQSSYIAGGLASISNSSQTKYAEIWQAITSHALDPNEGELKLNNEFAEAVLNYNPATCDELYDFSSNPNINSIKRQNAFVINLRNLGAKDSEYENDNFIQDNIIIPATAKYQNEFIFQPASTYPRILFENDNDSLYNTINRNGIAKIERAEGIFIVAVKDKGSLIVNSTGGTNTKSAYYDFYIRSCWFAPGAERPSTISTVIRLQDPAIINSNN